MKIYLDYIFIENFLINYILIQETAYISRRKLSKNRGIIATLIASVYVVIMMLFNISELNYWFCKILLAFVVVYISFKPKRTDEYIKLILLFLLVSIINAGTLTVTLNVLNLKRTSYLNKCIVYISSLFLSKFFMKYMWQMYKSKIKEDDLIYEVSIVLHNKEYKYRAFLDTGNNVFSYTDNIPIIFAELIDKEMLNWLDNNKSFNIETITLSSKQNKKAYKFDNIKIRKKDKIWHVKAAIVFENIKLSNNNNYNMLLNYILYTQNMGGIKI